LGIIIVPGMKPGGRIAVVKKRIVIPANRKGMDQRRKKLKINGEG